MKNENVNGVNQGKAVEEEEEEDEGDEEDESSDPDIEEEIQASIQQATPGRHFALKWLKLQQNREARRSVQRPLEGECIQSLD